MNDLISRLKNSGVIKSASNIKPDDNIKRLRFENVYSGDWNITKNGEVFVMEELIPFKTKHGKVEIKHNFETDELLKLFNLPKDNGKVINDFAFLDIETSSLSFGAGSFVFLIGICYFSVNGLHTKLLFIASPRNEPALLLLLDKILSNFPIIGSYNGKSFDLPFIRNRFHIHRIPYSLDEKVHVDLLHTSRRLWKRKLESCKLSKIEKHILSFERDSEEIPGWLVPQIYYDYLSSKNVKSLEGVFYHNRMDVISLSALTIYLSDYLSTSNSGKNFEELFRIAEIFEKNGDYQLANKFFASGFSQSSNLDIPPIFHRRYGLLLKRMEDLDAATHHWMIASEKGDYNSCIELAKYFEHRKKDYICALEWAKDAKTKIRENEFNKKRVFDIDHRISRLLRKINNMKSKHLKLLCIANGEMDAQLKKNYLISKSIEPILYEESLGTLYGLTNTPLGEVEIYVRNEDYESAKKALEDIK